MKLSKNIAKTLEKQIVPINASSDKCLIDITDIKTSPHIINRSRNLILEIKAKNKEIIKKFNEATSGVLCTSKAADQGADISGLSVAVIMSTDSSKIRKTQRIGRTIRFEEGKTAELFTLIIKGTQE